MISLKEKKKKKEEQLYYGTGAGGWGPLLRVCKAMLSGRNTIPIGVELPETIVPFSPLFCGYKALFHSAPAQCENPGLQLSKRLATLEKSFRCCSYFCLALSQANAEPKPSPLLTHPLLLPSALAPHRDDHQAITRELGNREEIQSLKGLNTGRGSGLVLGRGARCTHPGWDHSGWVGGSDQGCSYWLFYWFID